MVAEKSRKRRFKVPRGTGAKVAKELGLAASHVTRVINGKREGGPTLIDKLNRIEYNESMKGFRNSIRSLR